MTEPPTVHSRKSIRGADAQQCLTEASALLSAPQQDEAEVARQRLALLVEADVILASSPDLDATLDHVARLVVPEFADWCLVYQVEEDGAVRVAAMAHADPTRISWAREWDIGFPYDAHQSRGLTTVLSTGNPELYPEIPDEMLADAARSAEHLEALRQVGFSSCMIVPLRARDRVLGAITFVAAESGARYGVPDLQVAELLANRAAAAMDCARLSEEAEGAVRERRQAAEGLRAIAARARCLLWYADVEERPRAGLHWTLRVADEEAARRFLPLEVPPGYSYSQALSEARLPEDRARMAFGDEETRAGRSYHQEFRVRDSCGGIRWLAEDVQIEVIGPKHWYAVGVCVDVSERHRLEEALRQRAEALAEASRRKDEFMAMLAHELRNPLGAISNSLQVLQQPEAREEARRRALGVLERQIRHQARMVDDLLDVSRITRGLVEIRKAPQDLAALVSETVGDLRPEFREQGVELELELMEPAPIVAGDGVRLSQVFGNLLSNALKFTPRGGKVQVSVNSANGMAAVCLRDSGIGITQELLPHIFDSFVQGDRSLARSQGGLGLGLALVRGLVQLHGGSVTARSDGPGRGAEFVVRLPVASATDECRMTNGREPIQTGALPTRHSELVPRASVRVLVVEDNLDAAETLRDLLELAECTVEVVHTGRTAIDAARRNCPDVILCDIGLPDQDGYEIAAALRRDSATAGARLIAISGYGRDEDRQRSLEAGFDHHLVKPIALETLYSLVIADGP